MLILMNQREKFNLYVYRHVISLQEAEKVFRYSAELLIRLDGALSNLF